MIEVQLPSFLKHHNCGTGDGFRNRRERIWREFGGLYVILTIRQAKALFPKNFSAADNRYRN
jgi:hypothetical protein